MIAMMCKSSRYSFLPLLAGLALVLGGCATYLQPGKHPPRYTRIVAQPDTAIWSRVERWRQALEISDDDVVADSGRVRTWVWMSVRSGKDMFDCGVLNDDTLDMPVFLTRHELSVQALQENSTEITLTCTPYALLDSVDTGGVWRGTFRNDPRWLPCSSRGNYEREFLDKLEGLDPLFCGEEIE